ncbi:hypothetical protein [Tissierella pigra]|uniref:Uncharacterized protein n=1 Tax=Tissierella pigra TaxID=2607614 RepID=A0A6N7Y1P3_9FIRM|nr:hypothetical protein [Tissierella pigra]MSU01930.1 hypothetical protein [Tissierella pigra]
MAPSSDDKENKYKNWTDSDLKAECTNRKLEVDEADSKESLISILIKDDNKPPDWGKIYSRVLYHTGMAYEEIARRTIPQIMAILDGAEENISIKMGLPNMLGTSTLSPTPQNNGEPPTVNQFAAIANMFSGM